MPTRVLAGILGARNCRRQPEALDQYQQRLSAEIFYKYIQFEFFRQWSELSQYARHPNYWRHPDLRRSR